MMILLLISGIVGYVYRSQVDQYVKDMLDASMEHWCTSNPGMFIFIKYIYLSILKLKIPSFKALGPLRRQISNAVVSILIKSGKIIKTGNTTLVDTSN